MANTSLDTISISQLRMLIASKNDEYKEAIKNGKTLEEVKKIFKEKTELEQQLTTKEIRNH
jgi:cell division protein YceG involved in septum cleavage